MEELARNNRSLAIATVIMLTIMLAIIILGMVLFPMSAYDDPNAGPIRGLINSPGGNILVIAMFGVLACNIAYFLNTVIRLERERAAILERATAQAEAPQLPPTPQRKAIADKPKK
jgi:hypothetical protein